MITFNHFNFNVLDLDKSMRFYEEALGLKFHHESLAADGRYRIVFLTDGVTDFMLELTWLRDREQPYDLGDEELQRWAVSPLKTPKWASISSPIPTDTGWRSSPPSVNRGNSRRKKPTSGRLFYCLCCQTPPLNRPLIALRARNVRNENAPDKKQNAARR